MPRSSPSFETSVRELQTLARPAEIARDIREQRFVEHTLQIGIQAALDGASHVVSDERLGEPRTNRHLFELLQTHGWIEPTLSSRLQAMAGFRNVLVRGCDSVDLAIVRDVLEHRLGDLLQFVAVMRKRTVPSLCLGEGAGNQPVPVPAS